MARIQILELPMVHVGDAAETPFVVVIDQATEQTIAALDMVEAAPIEGVPFGAVQRTRRESLAAQLGARCVLCFEETVEIGGEL